MVWMDKYMPEKQVIDPSREAIMENGNQVGDLAMGLFGSYVEVTSLKDGKLDLSQMILRTKEEIEKGTPVICEASFSYEGLYCAVDLLRETESGWAIYEVKSSTKAEKPVYIADVAYQKYVLEHCGVKVTGTYLVCINNEYVFDGQLDLQQLFKITDFGELNKGEEARVEGLLDQARTVLASQEEPEQDIGPYCQSPYDCGYWAYCSRHLPSPSVFDLYRLGAAKKYAFYREGLITYEDLLTSGGITNKRQLRQLDYGTRDLGIYADQKKIRSFLSGLSYPLYFLDFETMQLAVPQYPGTRPYAQIPFQYSLHYILEEGGPLLHREFLAQSGEDPRRPIAEQLCRDIPMGVCTTAYHKSFECGRIKELAEAFPDLRDHLLDIADHIVDLETPFTGGYVYNRAMGGSFSIKSVLPALFPDDPSLNYHNLEGVHNGSEAMSIFPRIKDMLPDEQAQARENLLRYCELDTYAMVKVWQKLLELAE